MLGHADGCPSDLENITDELAGDLLWNAGRVS